MSFSLISTECLSSDIVTERLLFYFRASRSDSRSLAMSFQQYAETLADYRVRNVRASEEVFEKGSYILQHNGVSKLGSEGTHSLVAVDSVQ